MENSLSEEMLNGLGIYELRTIARQIGVYSPTTLKKGEIIEKIQNIITGKEKPTARKTKQGRPAKGIAKLNDIMDIFASSTNVDFTYAQKLNGDVSKNVFKHSLNSLNQHETMFSGVFQNVDIDHGVIYEDDFDYITIKNKCIVTSNFIDAFKLRDGDRVSCKCNYDDKQDNLVVIDVITINGVSAQNISNRPVFENLEYQIPKNQIVLTQNDFSSINNKVIDAVCPLFFGSRIIMNFENNDEFIKLTEIESLLKNNNFTNAHITMAVIDEMPEVMQYIKNNFSDIDLVYRREGQNYIALLEEIRIKFQSILRSVELGKNEIIIVFDYSKMFRHLVKGYSEWYNVSIEEAKDKILQKFTNKFNYAKQTNIGSSLSLCLLNCKEESFKELSNTYLYFNSLPYENSDITIDLMSSYTKNLGMVLNKKDYIRLMTFRNKATKENILQELNKLF